jgi:hypothetical protein
MFDFKEEVKKYKPALEADDLERELSLGDGNDVVKLLQYLVKKPDNIYSRNEKYNFLAEE